MNQLKNTNSPVILIADDDRDILSIIETILQEDGYQTLTASDGEQAVMLVQTHAVQLLILDIMMPEVDGLTVCKELRKRSSDLGIIMLSAKTQEMDKVTGLLVGADDYVTKPFSPSELMARVDAVYRRVEMTRGFRKNDSQLDTIVLDEFELNLRNRTLSKAKQLIELTQVEFQIIEYFFKNPNAALSRTDILKQVWGNNYFGDEKIVDVNIRRLRMKVEDNPSSPTRLVTIWGLGYKWITNSK